MKLISELIAELTQALNMSGDLPVWAYDRIGGKQFRDVSVGVWLADADGPLRAVLALDEVDSGEAGS